jgi:SAM-dependent methyltransferase
MKALYSAKDYWAGLASAYGSADANGFSPVLHPGAPLWFNATMDRLQERAWSDGLDRCALPDDSLVLDVGCGTGRWLARYRKRRLRPVGLDAAPGMLQRAANRNLSCPLVAAVAQHLPFPNETFALVSAVTVIQHIAPDGQRQALQEMARVIRPGGYLLLLDLIRGEGPHIFPRRPPGWIAESSAAGLSLLAWHGQEYLLLDRAFATAMHRIRCLAGADSEPPLPVQPGAALSPVERQSTGRLLYWLARRITCKTSEWLEPAARTLCPPEWATHGLFIFRK